MATPFTKGLIRAFMFYAVALFIAWLTYQIFGHSYIHGPGLHHVVGFLALLVGGIWMLIGLVRLLLNRHDRWNLGSLIVNVVVVFSVIVYFAVDFNEEDEAVESTNKADIITIHRDTNMNSSSIVDGFGDTILQKVGDSIIVDKTSEWARERDR